MTPKSKNIKLEQLKTDVAATTSQGGATRELPDPVSRLLAEQEKLRVELNDLRQGLGKTLDEGSAELKSEIAKRPLQSVISAFAIGIAMSLLLRR